MPERCLNRTFTLSGPQIWVGYCEYVPTVKTFPVLIATRGVYSLHTLQEDKRRVPNGQQEVRKQQYDHNFGCRATTSCGLTKGMVREL